MKLTLDQKIERREKANKTASKRLGKRVDSIERLADLADNRRSVYCKRFVGLMPAVVLMNMPATLVYRKISYGLVFEYERELEGGK